MAIKKSDEIILELIRDEKVVGYMKFVNVDGYMKEAVCRRVDGKYTRRKMKYHRVRTYKAPPVKRKPWILCPGRYLTEQEVGKLLKHLSSQATSRRGRVNQFLIQLLLGSGLRASELCRLRVSDTPMILSEPSLWVKEGKGNRDRRVVIGSDLVEAIEYFIKKVRPSLVPRRFRKHDYDQHLLLNEKGQPFNRRSLYSRTTRLGRRAGLLKTTGPHTFRHTFATRLYRAHKDILFVSSQLGHARIDTSAIYAKCDTPTDVQRALENMSNPSVGA